MKEKEKKEVNKKAMVQVEVQGEVKVKAAMVQVRWANMGTQRDLAPREGAPILRTFCSFVEIL